MDVADRRRSGVARASRNPRPERAHLLVVMRGMLVAIVVLAGSVVLPVVAAAEPLAPEETDPAVATPADAFEADPGDADYDPWQPFNERTFAFNHGVLDRYVIKPVATGWDVLMPDVAQRGIGRAFDNLDMPRRVVNNLLQLRPKEAGAEMARFLINTTVGIVGLIDVAHMTLHLDKSDADMGQTLGFYGIGAGPYLVLPFLPPLTVRDGIGRGVDSVLDPFGFLIPFVASTTMGIVKQVNQRSLNLELFADVEESVLDLYSAVRNGYLQRRRSTIEERRAARFQLHHDTVVARSLEPSNAAIAADALTVDGDRT
jgi:phospholipid-binding lipoprotein MlaA